MSRGAAWRTAVAVMVATTAAAVTSATGRADDGSTAGSGSGATAGGSPASAAEGGSGAAAGGSGATAGGSPASAAAGGSGAAAGGSGATAGGSPASAAAGGSGAAAGGSASGAGSAAPGQLLKIPLEAGAPEVNAAASPTVVNLGAHFTLFVRATFGPGVEVNLREPLDLGPAFEVRRRLSEDQRGSDGRITREWQLDVTPWELGDQELAPVAVTFTAFGRAGQVATNPVPLKIVGVLGDLSDDPSLMRGLLAPTGLTARDWFWIWVVTGASAGLGMAIAALWLHARRRRRTVRLVGGAIARPRRIDMTGARALERLLAIERSGVLDRDAERKAGYAEMVGVIREYLAARFRIASADLTSAELLGELGRRAQPDEVDLVAGWLADCDLVKYGGQRATPAEAGKALDDARALIVTTTATAEPGRAPPPPPPSPSPVAAEAA